MTNDRIASIGVALILLGVVWAFVLGLLFAPAVGLIGLVAASLGLVLVSAFDVGVGGDGS